MSDRFDDNDDFTGDDTREPQETPDYIAEVLGKIVSCDNIMWDHGAWCVELTLEGDVEVQLDLDEGEVNMLAAEEPLVAEEWDSFGGSMSDAQERESERRQMGMCDF